MVDNEKQSETVERIIGRVHDTPTHDDREALNALYWKHPDGHTTGLSADAIDAILAAGFRRSVVPEPSAEVIGEWFTSSHGVAVAAVAPITDRGPAVMVDGRVISPNDVAAIVEFKAQGQPSDALDLDALEALAKAATPGPWAPYETMQADNFVTAGGGPLSGTVVCGPTYERANTAFIAATDPQTVLALIAALRAASAVTEPQGEPSDAQVEAACRVLARSQGPRFSYGSYLRQGVRAALRAAGGVR